jgi:hypothetical protein
VNRDGVGVHEVIITGKEKITTKDRKDTDDTTWNIARIALNKQTTVIFLFGK